MEIATTIILLRPHLPDNTQPATDNSNPSSDNKMHNLSIERHDRRFPRASPLLTR